MYTPGRSSGLLRIHRLPKSLGVKPMIQWHFDENLLKAHSYGDSARLTLVFPINPLREPRGYD